MDQKLAKTIKAYVQQSVGLGGRSLPTIPKHLEHQMVDLGPQNQC